MGGGIGIDLIRGPVGQVIGLVVWLIVFPLLLGAINGWYLQAEDAGVRSGERFDRVVVQTGDDTAEEAWGRVASVSDGLVAADTALSETVSYLVTKNEVPSGDDTCKISAAPLTAALAAKATAYTPLGSKVQIPTNAAGAEVLIEGCKWGIAGEIFGAGGLSGLIQIILQAAGLAPPIAVLFALGTFGSSFLKNMGSHPILAAVVTVIGFLLLATLLNVFIPFVSGAFEAIDSNRFKMYQEGLGNVSTVVGSFYGVVIVSSIMTVAWQVLQALKGRNALSGGQQM